jgi:hypothetical protein
MQELHVQFDVIDSSGDFSDYKLLMLPDEIPVDEALAGKLENYLAGGGALLASYRSGLHPSGDMFTTDALGVRLKGDAPFSPDFIVPGDKVSNELKGAAYVMYQRGLEVEALPQAEILAQVEAPYFNRTWRHFCSHLHTPSSGSVAYPGVLRQGRVIYFSHPVFSQYRANAPRWCKQFVANAINLLLPKRVLEVQAPSTLQINLSQQPRANRYVLHLLHYIPERRGQAFDTIEDILPVYNTSVRIRNPKPVTAVRLVPQEQELTFELCDGRVSFTVPEVRGHQMVEIAL